MPKASLAVFVSRFSRNGSTSPRLLAAMAGSAVIIAGGYAVFSKGRGVTESSQANSAAFRPVADGQHQVVLSAPTGAKSSPSKASVSQTSLQAARAKPGTPPAREHSSKSSAVSSAPNAVQKLVVKNPTAQTAKAAAPKATLNPTKNVAAPQSSGSGARKNASRNLDHAWRRRPSRLPQQAETLPASGRSIAARRATAFRARPAGSRAMKRKSCGRRKSAPAFLR